MSAKKWKTDLGLLRTTKDESRIMAARELAWAGGDGAADEALVPGLARRPRLLLLELFLRLPPRRNATALRFRFRLLFGGDRRRQ